MAAQEPASLSLGELVRRASCPGVSTGAQAMKELGEERPGWLAGSLPPKASESPAARTLVFAGLTNPSSWAKARLATLFRDVPQGSSLGSRAAVWPPAVPRDRLWKVGLPQVKWVGLGLSRSQAGLHIPLLLQQIPGRGWQSSCGHTDGGVLPPLLAAGHAWPLVVGGQESVVVLTRHLGRSSSNWECPTEERAGPRSGSEDRRVLRQPTPKAAPAQATSPGPKFQLCWACSQPRVAPAHTAPWSGPQGWSWVSRGICDVQSAIPRWGDSHQY